MTKIVLLGYFILVASCAWALVPMEGILLGEAVSEYQQDPLNRIFSDIYDKTQVGENKKHRLYQSAFLGGALLQESCNLYQPPVYAASWHEKQAKRTMVSNLQYIGLDSSIKAIGAYARRFEMAEDQYKQLTSNLMKNYCSKNVTVFSLKHLEQAFGHYYKNPQTHLIPTVETSPFATQAFKSKTESTLARSNEFDQAIRNFRAFCSWGGDVVDYRMMVPYLKNSFIMSFLIKNMTGVQDKYDETKQRVEQVASTDTVQVACNDLICRKTTPEKFKQSFPRSVGSTGLFTDLAKLYCHHFRLQEYTSTDAIPQVKEWIKKQELEDPIFETSFFISLMTGVPDPTLGVENYRDLPAVAKSSIDERWNTWSNGVLNSFSRDLLYEESLNIKAHPRRDRSLLRSEGFLLDFRVTLGEMDRIVDESDKLAVSFDLKLTKNYLRQMRLKWAELSNNIDEEGKKQYREELARYIDLQLKQKEKMFRQKMWNEEFSRLIVQELLGQLQMYRGPMFESLEEQVLQIPVKFSYGIFALSYMRYRADVKAGRLRLNL